LLWERALERMLPVVALGSGDKRLKSVGIGWCGSISEDDDQSDRMIWTRKL
jgi:hypothetical protein